MKNILKIARNSNQDIVWQALYINGKKQVEASVLDIEKLSKIFNVAIDKEVYIYEEYPDDITRAFPKTEDFSYLMDYSDLYNGKLIYMEDGVYEVEKTWQFFRPRGVYKVNEWYPVSGGKNATPTKYIKVEQQRQYVSHWVTKFMVKGKEDEFIWEDIYNSNQSNLYKQYLLNQPSKVNI